MIRRRILRGILDSMPTAGFVNADSSGPHETLCRWERDNGLAILNMSTRAFDCSGQLVGTLKIQDKVSVSPDGRRIAWISGENADDLRANWKTSVMTMGGVSEESAVSLDYIEGLKRVNRVSLSSTGVTARNLPASVLSRNRDLSSFA